MIRKWNEICRSGVAACGFMLVAGCANAADTPAPLLEAADQGAVPHSRHSGAGSSLDDRVVLMTRELDLDPAQQAQLRTILQAHRAEVASVWSDASVPAAVRVSTTQAISEHTAERIRAILTDSQREKYNKPHRHDAPAVGAPGGDVRKWLKAGAARESARAAE